MQTSRGVPTVTGDRRPAVVARLVAASLLALAAVALGIIGLSAGPAGATTANWAGVGTTLPTNALAPDTSSLVSTACPSPGNCVAVGDYIADVGGIEAPHGLVDTEQGGVWTAAAAPAPEGSRSGELLGLSCASAGGCVAVGEYSDGSGQNQGLILTQHGSGWTATSAPLPPDAEANPDAVLLSVACAAEESCAASGLYEKSGGVEAGVLFNLTGGVWTATEVPTPSDARPNSSILLPQIACGAAGSCVAVGGYETTGGDERGLLEILSGGIWHDIVVPVPAGTGPVQEEALEGVSCPAEGTCTAVGAYVGSSSITHSVIESISGTTVHAIAGPTPTDGDPFAFLLGISCPTTTYCVSVGDSGNTDGSSAPLIATLSGGVWTAITAPGQFGTSQGQSLLTGVSCSWPGSCAAFGVKRTGENNATGITETLTDGSWTGTTSILPSNAAVPHDVIGFEGESLGTPVACTAGACTETDSYATVSSESGFINTYPNLDGYQLAAADGGIFAFNAPFFGSMGGQPLAQPVVGVAPVPDSGGYYEAAADGGIFAFHAPFAGSMAGQHLNAPIVGVAFDSKTGGYYEVASDGGIFAFNAPYAGSMGGQHLNAPIVGMAFDAQTGGYYEVASDGGIFAFNAPFAGSMGGQHLNAPVVGMAYNSQTGGYYEVASDGGIFAFNAPFAGSMGGQHLNAPVVGMSYDWVTGGYYEVGADGGVFAFDAPFAGSTGGLTLTKPVVGMAFG